MVVVEICSSSDDYQSLWFQDLRRGFEWDKARGQKPSSVVKFVYSYVVVFFFVRVVYV